MTECSSLPNCARCGQLSYAIFALARAHRGLAAEFLRKLGLHPGQELLFMRLMERNGQTQSELLDSAGLDHSTVSKSLRRMEEAGLLKRVPDKNDRRLLRVHLTKKGRQLGPRLQAMWGELEQASIVHLSSAEKKDFIAIAEKIQRAIMAQMGDAT
jgi:MarR family transcriptional regulator, organic hydroperoxide resistance regulator